MKTKNKIQPFFSIITVVKNNKKMMKNLFFCLKKLKYKNFEHIVVDGMSNDGTTEVIKKNKKKIKVSIIEKDKGIYHAMNKGIRVSKGKYIGILNSDDEYTPDALNIIYKYINDNNFPDFIFGSVIKGRLIMSGYHPKKIFYRFNVFPSHSGSFFIKNTVQKKIGYYDANFKYSADYDLIYRLINKNFIGICTNHNEITGKFYTKGISSKLSFFKKTQEEFKVRLKNKQNVLFLICLFFLVFLNKLRNLLFNRKKKKSF